MAEKTKKLAQISIIDSGKTMARAAVADLKNEPAIATGRSFFESTSELHATASDQMDRVGGKHLRKN